MGRVAVKALETHKYCDNIVVADIHGETAKNFADECGPSVSWAQVDISDDGSLKKAVKDADVVMNTVGPYYRYGVKVLNASIEGGCHYLDINDDWEPTLDMLNLHETAEKAGITAVIGMGASPGMTNLLAVKAMSELDSAEEIYTCWDLDSAKPETIKKEPSAALVHAIHQTTGQIRAFRDGDYVDEKPLKQVRVEYPGLGTRPFWTFGHPEAVTLPNYDPRLRSSVNLMTTSRLNIWGIRTMAWFVDVGLLSVRNAAGLIEKAEGSMDPENTPEKMLQKVIDGKGSVLPPLFALAKGTRNGEPASVASTILSAPAAGMGGSTGVPLAVGVSLLADGQTRDRGVFAPEGIFDPDAFFSKLAGLCSPPKTDVHELVLTSRSWEPATVIDVLGGSESSRNS
jgi:saccharopine dehydrogenase-like NADP-dependent oxidoreductase